MKFFIEAFECQMNENDTERIQFLLENSGHEQTGDISESDVVILNTCTVRESAKNRQYGHLGNLKKIKNLKKDILICIGGGGAQDLKQKIIKDFPYVEIVFWPQNITTL